MKQQILEHKLSVALKQIDEFKRILAEQSNEAQVKIYSVLSHNLLIYLYFYIATKQMKQQQEAEAIKKQQMLQDQLNIALKQMDEVKQLSAEKSMEAQVILF